MYTFADTLCIYLLIHSYSDEEKSKLQAVEPFHEWIEKIAIGGVKKENKKQKFNDDPSSTTND